MELMAAIRNAQAARKSSGKNIPSQLVEIVKLRLGPAKLGADDYYMYRLHDDLQFTFAEKSQFLGWRRSAEIDSAINSDEWRVFANDKIKFSEAMAAAGLDTPKIFAIFAERGKSFPGAQLLSTDKQVADFFIGCKDYPVFCKPVHGTYGRGGFSVLAADSDSSCLRIGDGSVRLISDVAQQFKEKWAEGYIVQELLTPHPEVKALVGERLSSLRVVVLQVQSNPYIHRAVWKLPVGRNMSDNFMHGKLGNLIANVNPQDGKVTNVMGKQESRIVKINKHPDTAVDLGQLTVPLWPKIADFCGRASKLFPGLAMQHWDVAICPQGPVAIEVNVEGSVDLHQLAGRKGFFDKRLETLVMQHSST